MKCYVFDGSEDSACSQKTKENEEGDFAAPHRSRLVPGEIHGSRAAASVAGLPPPATIAAVSKANEDQWTRYKNDRESNDWDKPPSGHNSKFSAIVAVPPFFVPTKRPRAVVEAKTLAKHVIHSRVSKFGTMMVVTCGNFCDQGGGSNKKETSAPHDGLRNN